MLPVGTESTVPAQEYRFPAQGWGREVSGPPGCPTPGGTVDITVNVEGTLALGGAWMGGFPPPT